MDYSGEDEFMAEPEFCEDLALEDLEETILAALQDAEAAIYAKRRGMALFAELAEAVAAILLAKGWRPPGT